LLEAVRERGEAFDVPHVLAVLHDALHGIRDRIADRPMLVSMAYNAATLDEAEATSEQLHGVAFVVLQGEVTSTKKRARELATRAGFNAPPIWEAAERWQHVKEILTAANYYKHRDEWPDDWDVATCDPKQKKTIEDAIALGMRHDAPDNLAELVRGHFGCDRLNELEQFILDWRRDVHRRCHKELTAMGLL
jgi:hypothetical protein